MEGNTIGGVFLEKSGFTYKDKLTEGNAIENSKGKCNSIVTYSLTFAALVILVIGICALATFYIMPLLQLNFNSVNLVLISTIVFSCFFLLLFSALALGFAIARGCFSVLSVEKSSISQRLSFALRLALAKLTVVFSNQVQKHEQLDDTTPALKDTTLELKDTTLELSDVAPELSDNSGLLVQRIGGFRVVSRWILNCQILHMLC